MGNLKKAIFRMRQFRDRRKEEREKDLADKRDALGQCLPDISLWEEYVSDHQVVSTFQEALDNLENATDLEIQLLQDRPGKMTHNYAPKMI